MSAIGCRTRDARPGADRIEIRWLSLRGWGSAINLLSLAGALVVIRVTLLDQLWGFWPAPHQRAAIALAALVALVGVVGIHEFGHAYVLARYRLGPVELRVSPGLGFVRVPDQDLPWRAVLAGPLASITAGLAATTVVRAMPDDLVPSAALRVVFWSGRISLLMGLGNLLPIAPLDGSRLLEALVDAFGPPRHVRHLRRCLAIGGLVLAGCLTAHALIRQDWFVAVCLSPLAVVAWLSFTDDDDLPPRPAPDRPSRGRASSVRR